MLKINQNIKNWTNQPAKKEVETLKMKGPDTHVKRKKSCKAAIKKIQKIFKNILNHVIGSFLLHEKYNIKSKKCLRHKMLFEKRMLT